MRAVFPLPAIPAVARSLEILLAEVLNQIMCEPDYAKISLDSWQRTYHENDGRPGCFTATG